MSGKVCDRAVVTNKRVVLSKVLKREDTPSREPNDDALVHRVRAGDRRAYSLLVQRHEDTVFRVCYRILGDRHDAEDAAQESFVRAYEKLDTFQGRSSFKTWITRLTVNVSLNEVNKRKAPLTEMPYVAPVPDPEDELLRGESVANLHEALKHLPAKHNAAVVLKDLEGLSFREVGEALAVPEGTARVWAHRGRARLKDILTGEERREPSG